jgi:predicted molibdopterin-dependent oxidoreductase YjgC
MTIHLTIDGQDLTAEAGQTVLQVAAKRGIPIPTLCYHKDLSPSGNCRMCVIEVKGSRSLQAACVTPASDGMEIRTGSERVIDSRRTTLELMLANHPLDCLTCDVGGECELQDLAYEYRVEAPAWAMKSTRYVVDGDSNPFVRVDFNKCILCRRCVAACAEIQVRDVWGVSGRGFGERITAGADSNLLEARCESCGQCVAYCPTGALSNKLNFGLGRAHQLRKVPTTCSYCGVGCQFDLLVKDGQVIGVSSNPDAPVNGMALCVKGRYGYDYIHHPDRLQRPRVRRYLLEGRAKDEVRDSRDDIHDQGLKFDSPLWEWVETDWETALGIAADKLGAAGDAYGPDGLGILTSAKCLNEENYLMNKLARQVLGTNNIDHCARL